MGKDGLGGGRAKIQGGEGFEGGIARSGGEGSEGLDVELAKA